MCSQCPAGYYGNSSGLCVICDAYTPTFNPELIFLIIILLFAFSVPLSICVFKIKKKAKAMKEKKAAKAEADKAAGKTDSGLKAVAKLAQESFSIKHKIIVSMIQVTSGISNSFQTEDEEEAEGFDNSMSALSAIELNFARAFPFECDLKVNADQKMFMTTFMPMVAIVVLLSFRLIAVGAGSLFEKCGAQKLQAKLFAIADQVEEYVMLIIFLVFVACSTAAFHTVSPYACVDFTKEMTATADNVESSFRKDDLSVDCLTDEHALYVTWAWLMVLVYPIGTPLIYIFVYRRNYDKIKPLIENEAQVNAATTLEELGEKHPEMMTDDCKTAIHSLASGSSKEQQKDLFESLPKYMRPLVRPYEYSCYWFEVFECLRKLALTGVTIFFPAGSMEQLVFTLIICVFLSWIYHHKQPYKNYDDDVLAAVCQASVFLVLVSRIVLQNADRFADGETWVAWIDIFLALSVIVPCIMAVLMTAHQLQVSEERAEFVAKKKGVSPVKKGKPEPVTDKVSVQQNV
jgi:hypothetical protein